MNLSFCKYHGLGNDYLFFDCFRQTIENPGDLARKLTDRRRSVGGDGIILMEPSLAADARMRIFNADGSEGKMCGNGIRCAGKFLYERKKIRKKTLRIETLSGIKKLELSVSCGKVDWVTADMGKPVFLPEKIPVKSSSCALSIAVGGETFQATCLSMGNPHCVIFCDSFPDVGKFGPLIERHEAFPDRVNAEFVRLAGDRLEVRVWERGSGETSACGTGACAAAVAATVRGFFGINRPIEVCLPGGILRILYTGETVFMGGPAQLSFVGKAVL